MPKRYTITELKNMPDEEIIYWLAHDRQESVTNRYSPLNQRLNELMRRFGKLAELQHKVVSLKFVEEVLQNESSLKGNEIMKIRRILKEGLNNPKIRC